MIKEWAAKAATRGVGILAALLMRRAIAPLLKVDAKLLVDIGLSRADVIDCLSTPVTADPTELLALRREKRRQNKAGKLIDLRERITPEVGFSVPRIVHAQCNNKSAAA